LITIWQTVSAFKITNVRNRNSKIGKASAKIIF